MTKLHDATSDALNRLGDLANDIWSRDEIGLYIQDAYDQYCHDTKALFDIVVIENLPPVGNWQTDLERYLALQIPGMAVTDGPFHMTDDSERNYGIEGRVGGTYRGPAGITNPTQRNQVDNVDSVPTAVPGGYLPQSTVEILRVTYDNNELIGMHSSRMRQLDSDYENSTGDPQYYTYDKDGLFFLRVIPAASGDAVYPTNNGGFGTITQVIDTPESGETIDSLAGYWELGSDTTPWLDTVGTNNFATAFGSPASAGGKFGSAVLLSSASIQPGTAHDMTTAFSYSFWYKPPVTGSSVNVLQPDGGTATDIVYLGASDILQLSRTSTTNGTAVLSPGTFYHIVYTYDGVDTSKLYVNGALDITHAVANASSHKPVLANGTFDEFSYYTEALTQDQIDFLYNEGDGVFYVDGAFQTLSDSTVETLEANGSSTGGYGILRYRDDSAAMFPAGGPWGSPTRIHPSAANIKVEVIRLGRNLASYPIELPDAYTKYVIFGAMSRALRRDGPGQDIALADHYEQRFNMGVDRMKKKLNKMQPERVGRLGYSGGEESFGLGLPQLPSAYENPWR